MLLMLMSMLLLMSMAMASFRVIGNLSSAKAIVCRIAVQVGCDWGMGLLEGNPILDFSPPAELYSASPSLPLGNVSKKHYKHF